MKYTVKCMYRNGVRLTCDELEEAAAHTGLVVVEEPPSGPSKLLGRKARLFDTRDSEAQCDALPPLFEAKMLGVDRGHMMIHGHQIHIDMMTGAVRQQAQCWLISKLAKF